MEKCLADSRRPDAPKQIAFLSGPTGVGKVDLADRAFPREACWYGYAKFTRVQQRGDEAPCGELSRCLAQIVAQLLPRRSEVIVHLRERLTVQDADELVGFCPEADALQIYSPPERAVVLGTRAAKNYYVRVATRYLSLRRLVDADVVDSAVERVKYVVKLFLRAVSAVRPVVWVLDDLQYAAEDGMSLPFLRTVLADHRLTNFVFCGILREEECIVSQTKTSANWVSTHHYLDEENLAVRVRVSNMSPTNVKDMLADLLKSDDVDELASLIHQRTNGNDFFVLQLIDFLQEECILTFSTWTYKWQWDIDEIKRKSMVGNNVLALVGKRLQRLPRPVQRCLQMAAYLGYRFDEDLLERVLRSDFVRRTEDMQDDTLSVHDLLQVGLKENFIEDIDMPTVVRYKFVHVEIQSACQHLFAEEETSRMAVEKLHWNIAAALWRGWRHRDSYGNVENRMIFPCVKEANAGKDAFNLREGTRYQLVRLNHEAAKRSYVLHAFFPAATYLQTAVGLLGKSDWEDRYDLTLELHTFMAQMYLASGQLGLIPAIVALVQKNARSFQDRLPVEIVALTRLKMEGRLEDHIRKCVALLNLLGVRLRTRGYFRREVETRKRKLKETFYSMTNNDIRRKAEASGNQAEAVFMIEQELLGSLLNSPLDQKEPGKAHPNLAIVTACHMVTAFVQEEGRPDNSPLSLALAAALFCTESSEDAMVRKLCTAVTCSRDEGDTALSVRLAEEALTLPNSETDPQMVATVVLIRHWRYPLANCTEIMLRGYNAGMKRYGSFRTENWYIQFYVHSTFFIVLICHLHIVDAAVTSVLPFR